MWYFKGFALLLLLMYSINSGEGLKCYKCGVKKSCFYDFNELEMETCADDVDSCITSLKSINSVMRGCKAKNTSCLPTNCRECNYDGCNTHIVCYKCGFENNGNCTGSTTIEVCPGEKDKCLTQITDDKTVEQKCVDSSVKCDINKAKTCAICERSFCRNVFNPFPTDRRLCYQCKEDYNSNCDKLESVKPFPCKFYDENEKCYSIGTSNMNMKRGCMSDIDHKCFGEKCLTCDKDGCNNIRYSRQPSRKCFQCGPEDNHCSKKPILCKNEINYWKQTEECFIQLVENGIVQGCVNDRKADDKPCNAENPCQTCDTDGCNFVSEHDDEDYFGSGITDKEYIYDEEINHVDTFGIDNASKTDKNP